MRSSAPSFSFSSGETVSILSLEDLKENQDLIEERIVVLHPGSSALLNPKGWIRVLSSSYYLIICSSYPDSYAGELKKEAERRIYSLNPPLLSGVSICSSPVEAEAIVSAVQNETGRGVITVNNTEGDL